GVTNLFDWIHFPFISCTLTNGMVFCENDNTDMDKKALTTQYLTIVEEFNHSDFGTNIEGIDNTLSSFLR
ncbi:MAG: hypothetical protein WCW62_16905, partial [Bacteroidales bacterium]